MKTSKLVTGIISIILFVIISFQSCTAGLVNTVQDNGEASGSMGFLLALCMLVGGIVGIATRNGAKKGANITVAAFYLVGALMGFAGSGGAYKDLIIWSVISAGFSIPYILSTLKKNNRDGQEDAA